MLCDHAWLDPDRDDANGVGPVDGPSVLRIDALIMAAQVRLLGRSPRAPLVTAGTHAPRCLPCWGSDC